MMEYRYSEHARDMLRERNIREAWVQNVMNAPEKKEARDDGTVHYLGSIEECQKRYLRVVVNPVVKPQRIITLFFDRKLGRAR